MIGRQGAGVGEWVGRGCWVGETRFRERSLIEGSESMAVLRGSVEPVSDGVAFNRRLCLSQLYYIMVPITWANAVLRKCCVQ